MKNTLIYITLLLFLIAPCTLSAESLDQLIRSADKMYAAGKVSKVLALYKRAYMEAGDAKTRIRILGTVAAINKKNGHYAAAWALAKAILEIDPTNSWTQKFEREQRGQGFDFYYRAANTAFEFNNVHFAKKWYAAAILKTENDQQKIKTLGSIAVVNEKSGDLVGQQQALKKILELDPSNHWAIQLYKGLSEDNNASRSVSSVQSIDNVVKTSGSTMKNKFALVIGNANYRRSPLSNTINDAADISEALEDIGFDVKLAVNQNLAKMKQAISRFSEKMEPGDIALFYYAGHAVQYQGRNFLLPVDTLDDINIAQDLPSHAIDLDDIVNSMNPDGEIMSALILDSCRNSPLDQISEIGSGLSRGLRRLKRGDNKEFSHSSSKNLNGILVAYSTSPGATALDGTGRNSPYTKSLLSFLRREDKSIEWVLKNTRTQVKRETNDAQTPWYESSIDGDVYLAGQKRIPYDIFTRLSIGMNLPLVKQRLGEPDIVGGKCVLYKSDDAKLALGIRH